VDKGFLPTRPVTVTPDMIDSILAEDGVKSFNKATYGKSLGTIAQKSSPAIPAIIRIDPPKLVSQNKAIQVSWSKAKGVDYYNLYWSYSINLTPENGQKIGRLTSDYAHTHLTGNKSYYYILVPVIKGKEGMPSPVVSAKPLLELKAPEKLTAARQDAQVSLDWSPVPDAEGYFVYWSFDKAAITTVRTSVKVEATHFEHTGDDQNKIYYYAIRAYNGDVTGPLSEIVSVLPPKEPVPDTPANIKIDAGNSAIILQWDKATHASEYVIYWSVKKDEVLNGTAKKIQVKKNQYLHENLDNGTTYYYAVSGMNKDEEGPKTAIMEATPQIWLSIINFFKDLGTDEEETKE